VVKPGGRVLMVVYGDPHRVEFLGFFVAAIQTVRPGFEGPPMDPPPLPFQLQDPDRLRQELAGAGLSDITVETITETTEFDSGRALWEWIVWSNPIPRTVLDGLELSADELAAIREALEGLVRERAGESPVARLTNPIHIGVGTK